LLESLLKRRGKPLGKLRWLDIGCGRGELLRFGHGRFLEARGCDPSEEMLRECGDLAVKHQPASGSLPFDNGLFDVVTAACVYHHLTDQDRAALANEARRVMRPGGIFVIFEHNPWNPATRLIVSRTPVDADARLLSAGEARRILRNADFQPIETCYYLYFPQSLFMKLPWLERLLARPPLGGQYAVIAEQKR
jgi:SAM-dependent methyltransferase